VVIFWVAPASSTSMAEVSRRTSHPLGAAEVRLMFSNGTLLLFVRLRTTG